MNGKPANLGNVVCTECFKIMVVSEKQFSKRYLKYLTKKGYRVIEATPVDMFPMTCHIECVVALEK